MAVVSTPSMISRSEASVCSLSSAPSATRCVRFLDESGDFAGGLIRSLGKLADFIGDDGESPMPCSPARAASIAAFKARRLVWLAISEITWMISLIFSELVRISRMAAMDWRTALPPFSASLLVPSASLSAAAALSFTMLIDSASPSTAAVISSTLALWGLRPLRQALRAFGDGARHFGELGGAVGHVADHFGEVDDRGVDGLGDADEAAMHLGRVGVGRRDVVAHRKIARRDALHRSGEFDHFVFLEGRHFVHDALRVGDFGDVGQRFERADDAAVNVADGAPE